MVVDTTVIIVILNRKSQTLPHNLAVLCFLIDGGFLFLYSYSVFHQYTNYLSLFAILFDMFSFILWLIIAIQVALRII